VDDLRAAAGRLDTAADTIVDTSATAALDGSSPADFGAEAPGRLGELGTALHGRWVAALEDRRGEAAGAAVRLAELATSLRAASSGYADTDLAVRRRQPEEG
jgi:hypothetical protein